MITPHHDISSSRLPHQNPFSANPRYGQPGRITLLQHLHNPISGGTQIREFEHPTIPWGQYDALSAFPRV